MTAPKQGIQLKQTQTLTVTPEMQQSLKVLQYNRQELEQEIARMLDENIMLERLDSDDAFQHTDSYDDYDEYGADEFTDQVESLPDDIPDIIDSDVEWEDICEVSEYECRDCGDTDAEGFQDNWVSDSDSFDETLAENIFFSQLSESEKQLAMAMLSYLDDNYFLTLPIDKLARKLHTTTPIMTRVVDAVKHFDPAGVGSQNIQECLLAQLHNLPIFDESIGDANDILADYFTYIGQKDDLIKQRLGLDDEAFENALQVIRTLSPYPRTDEQVLGQRITPDIYVHKRMGVYYASLNRDARFDIGLNEEYASMTTLYKGDEKLFMQSQLKLAKFFLRALDLRHQTILRVGNAIVMAQQEYFDDGDKAIKPLLMKDLADVLGLAESTISRTVNGKYLSFNRRLIELRHFFSNEIKTVDGDIGIGGEVSNSAKAVKALIKEMIDNEPPRKPLSDTKIEKELKEQGIEIARRTVAKYREAMGFPPASKRKRLN